MVGRRRMDTDKKLNPGKKNLANFSQMTWKLSNFKALF